MTQTQTPETIMLNILTSVRSFDPIYSVGRARESGLTLADRRVNTGVAFGEVGRIRGALKALQAVALSMGPSVFSAISEEVAAADSKLIDAECSLIGALEARTHEAMETHLYNAALILEHVRYVEIPNLTTAVKRDHGLTETFQPLAT